MASTILSSLGGAGISAGLTGVAKVIDAIRGKDPEAAAQLAKLVEDHKSEFQLAELQVQAKAIESSAQVVTAEANSQSWLPRNVRPLMILFWGSAITVNVIAPIIARFAGVTWQPIPIEPWVYKLTAIGFTGYVAGRSWEKINDKDT